MPKALVTGGAGFIGSHLVGKLLSEGWDVRVVDNLERGTLENVSDYLDDIDFWGVDLRDSYGWCRGVDVVFHLASKVGSMQYYLDNAYEVFSTNSMIDSLVLKSAIHHEVEHYVYASSAHVYSPEWHVMIEENAFPANPSLSYGWAKLMGEIELNYAPIPGASARITGAYGPRQDFDLETCSANPAFIRRAIEYSRVPFKVLSNGKERRSYCYVSDVVDALFRLIGEMGAYNVGSETDISIENLVYKVASLAPDKNFKIEFADKEARVKKQQPLCARMHMLGWEPRVSLDEGLRKTYDYALTREWAKHRQG